MGQGNPNKVNSIIDKIVDGNNIFKLKSPIEQDKEKDSMAKSINSALSSLNEVGRELVLQDLSVDPDEKFKGFIDNVGNIDILGIAKFTTTIVKAKIEEAEREGIDLRSEATQIFKDNKNILVDGILTTAVIDTMIRDYDKLSAADKNSLARNWNNMLPNQKREYASALGNALKKKADKTKNPDLERKLKKISDTVKRMPDEEEDYSQQLNEMSNSQLQEYIKNLYGKDSSILQLSPQKQREYLYNKFIERDGSVVIEVQEDVNNPPVINEEVVKNKIDEVKNEIDEEKNKINKMEVGCNCNLYVTLGISHELPITLEEFEKSSTIDQSYILEYVEQNLKDTISLNDYLNQRKKDEEKKAKDEVNLEDLIGKKSIDEIIKKDIDNIYETELQQLPLALAKANFSQENIQEALKQYKEYISGYSELDEETQETIKSSTEEEIKLNIEDDFNTMKEEGQISEEVHQILNIMAGITFDGKIQQILTNTEMRESFLQQFDQVIEQGINPEQNVKLDGELVQVFSQYFKDQAVEMDTSIIEATQEHESQLQQEENQKESIESKKEEKVMPELNSQPDTQDRKNPIEEGIKPTEIEVANIVADGSKPFEEPVDQSQEVALEVQDNSFIGKIKRLAGLMRNKKENDKSQGFFSRLRSSVQEVFGNKNTYEEQSQDDMEAVDNTSGQAANQNQLSNDVFQRVTVNSLEAVAKTEASRVSKANTVRETDEKNNDEELTQ